MLAERNPQAAYRRVDFDARVHGADPAELVTLCFEQFVAALGSALFAHEKGDNRMKSEALTRAVSAVTALHLGVSGEGGVADSLRQIYIAARRSVLDCVLVFDGEVIRRIRQDFAEIGQALSQARPH